MDKLITSTGVDAEEVEQEVEGLRRTEREVRSKLRLNGMEKGLETEEEKLQYEGTA